MRIAHLADLHLGYRNYHRVDERGRNVREADVFAAVRHAAEEIRRRRPDAVLVAGDVFHSVRPSNWTITEAFRLFAELARGLDGAPIVLIAGNHDSPRSAETGHILHLFAEIPRVHVATHAPRWIHVPECRAAILAVPHAALVEAQQRDDPMLWEPDPSAERNILVLHAGLAGPRASVALGKVFELGGVELSEDRLDWNAWTYVALGHYHERAALDRHVHYPGAVERTSANLWQEQAAKGWLWVDLDADAVEFCPVPTRPVVDLEPIRARRLTAEEINAQVAARLAAVEGGVDGKILRLIVYDFDRTRRSDLDWNLVREVRARALHFHLDLRAPEADEGPEGAVNRAPLRQRLELYLRQRPLVRPELEREALVALGLRLWDETDTAEEDAA